MVTTRIVPARRECIVSVIGVRYTVYTVLLRVPIVVNIARDMIRGISQFPTAAPRQNLPICTRPTTLHREIIACVAATLWDTPAYALVISGVEPEQPSSPRHARSNLVSRTSSIKRGSHTLSQNHVHLLVFITRQIIINACRTRIEDAGQNPGHRQPTA